MSGTLITREVRGSGYHDHQWGDSNFQLLWNHWRWARQGFDDYSILVFDFVASAKSCGSRETARPLSGPAI